MTYTITRDGATLATAPTLPEAYQLLHGLQGQSVYWAVMHEGWNIICPDGQSVRAEFQNGKNYERLFDVAGN